MRKIAIPVLLSILISACSSIGIGATPTPTPNPVEALVHNILPLDYKYVSDYVTTEGGDSVWVIEITGPQTTGLGYTDAAIIFREFAKAVDTSNVAWLKISVINMPYAYRVSSGPARAAAKGAISIQDLFELVDWLPK
jgi:hypothetical protein